MPVFTFTCVGCGWEGEDVVNLIAGDPPQQSVCPKCSAISHRKFSPTTNLRMAPWMSNEAFDGRARQQRWMETPEVQAKLKSGEFAIASGDKYAQNEDGPAASSSITTRMEAGLSLSA